MAFAHGKNHVFRLDNAAGVLQNLSAYVDESSPSREMDSAEVTNAGSGGVRAHLPGLEGATISMGGPWDPVLDLHMSALQLAFRNQTVLSATFEIYPAGMTTGLPYYTGECILTSYEISNTVDDAVRWTSEAIVTGGVTRSLVP